MTLPRAAAPSLARTVEAAIAEVIAAGTNPGFVPAGGTEIDTLTQCIDRSSAPVLLDLTTETAVMAQGWTR
ncbi:hypothetical protein [Cypionkella sp.]|uniref:hypothetical protein n=1 Tax=Cypionkella sp. TaxID=2811411 RepID=UPI002AC999F0|nr:hypothetical protein [Cypionkella sp.]